MIVLYITLALLGLVHSNKDCWDPKCEGNGGICWKTPPGRNYRFEGYCNRKLGCKCWKPTKPNDDCQQSRCLGFGGICSKTLPWGNYIFKGFCNRKLGCKCW